MGYYNIIMPRENAWEIMNELGELSAVQFVDLNSHEQILSRQFSGYIRRCEEIELKIHAIEQLMIKFKKPVERCTEYKAYLTSLREIMKKRNKAEHTYLDDVETELEEKLTSLNTQIRYYDGYVESHNTIIEQIHVLEAAQVYFSDDAEFHGPGHDMSRDDEENKSELGDSRVFRFQYLAGVIDGEDSQRFRRVLFRATLGMVWSTLIDIDSQPHNRDDFSFVENLKSENKRKCVFLIAYPGGEQDILKSKLNKIADSFGAHKYGIPQDKTSFRNKLADLRRQCEDGWKILEITKQHIEMVLDTFANPRHPSETWSMIESFRLFVLKEKAIYHNLNMLKPQNTVFYGNLWCPFYYEDIVKTSLDNLSKVKPHLTRPEFEFAEKPEHCQPPTFFRTNDFSAPFQEIVNTYGVPRYQEINPGLFTIATFPFLFGVMFGDIGHGAALFAFGLYLCFAKDHILREKGGLSALLPARYLVAMLGFFALYCGFIYNDFMALPLNIFGSCWEESEGGSTLVKKDPKCVYPFGLDPAWYGASNELAFFNSFKMKMAIILGVSQMILGTMLKMLNSIFFRSKLDFFFEWIPQITFLCCTFGYMVVLIFLKWATPYGVQGGIDTSEAPAIINIFIKFLLSMGKFDTGSEPNLVRPLYGDEHGVVQSTTQRTLLILAVVTVPWMLLPKPIILNFLNKQSLKKAGYHLHNDDVLFMHHHPHKEEVRYKFILSLGTEFLKFFSFTRKGLRDLIQVRRTSCKKLIMRRKIQMGKRLI